MTAKERKQGARGMIDENKRRHGVGASEIAALIGPHPYLSRYEMWARKTGLADPVEPSLRMKLGTVLEAPILSLWSRETGAKVVPNSEAIPDPTGAPVWATPDGFLLDDDKRIACVEIKTAARARDWADGVPWHISVQAQCQMMVTGLPRCMVVVLIAMNDLREYTVEADADLHARLREAAVEFMRQVSGELPGPDPDGSESSQRVLDSRVRDQEAPAVTLSAKVAEFDSRLFAVEDEIRKLEQEKKRLRQEIQASLGASTRGVFSDGNGWEIVTVSRGEHLVKANTFQRLSRFSRRGGSEE